MKKLDTSPIAPGISFPIKGGTLQFLQLAYQECITELITSRIGSSYNPGMGYILNGCANNGSGSNYSITAGSVFFNGEIYLVDATSFSISGSNVAEGVITTTQYTSNADAVTFTDAVARNVHNIRKMVFQPGLAGSGAVDFNSLVNLAYRPVGGIGQVINWKVPNGGLLTTYFDGTGLGIHPLTLQWAIANGANGTDDYGTYVQAGYKPGDANFGIIGQTQGEPTHLLTVAEMPSHNHAPGTVNPSPNDNGLAVNGGNAVGRGGGMSASQWTANTGGGAAHNNLQPTRTVLMIQKIA